MGQVITSDTMSLQEKLAAIAEAIKQLEGNTNEIICEGCE
jgi:hypothetical protein